MVQELGWYFLTYTKDQTGYVLKDFYEKKYFVEPYQNNPSYPHGTHTSYVH
jgi:hypothetical protein